MHYTSDGLDLMPPWVFTAAAICGRWWRTMSHFSSNSFSTAGAVSTDTNKTVLKVLSAAITPALKQFSHSQLRGLKILCPFKRCNFLFPFTAAEVDNGMARVAEREIHFGMAWQTGPLIKRHSGGCLYSLEGWSLGWDSPVVCLRLERSLVWFGLNWWTLNSLAFLV